MRNWWIAALLAVLLAVQCRLLAQTNSGTLSGTVTDPSGAVVPGADVSATNFDTGVVQETKTNSAGQYVFASLLPGTYKLSVKSQGFKEFDKQPLVLHVQDRISQNVTLEVGGVNQVVSVTAEAQSMDTQDASVSTVVDRATVQNMPLNGRSFQGLITLAPGVETVGSTTNNGGQFVVNGQRSDANYFTVDGVSANTSTPIGGNTLINGTGSQPSTNAVGGYSNMVSLDALQEFRISTSSFAPEFGRTPGGQISLVSRSGANAFHGDVFDYLRNTVLDANDWFLNAAGKARGVVQQNDFGGAFGGRIIKDKLFFFGSYEGLRLNAPSPGVKLVPTQSMRNLAAAASNNGVTGYMAQFWNAFPLPDAGAKANATCTSTANCVAAYTATLPGRSRLDATSIRVDYKLSHNMSLFGRWSHSPSSSVNDDTVKSNSLKLANDVYTAGWTTVISNTMTNDARFNFTHSTYTFGSTPLNFKGSPSTIFPSGFAQPPAGFQNGSYALQFSYTGGDAVVLAPNQRNHGNDQLNVVDSFTRIVGSHQLKFGADFRQLTPAADQSNLNWNNQFNQLAGNTNNCPGGLPAYICGNASLSNIQHLVALHFRIRQYDFYGQDTWRILPRLTMTYGVRWDIDPATDYLTFPAFAIDPSTFNTASLKNLKVKPLGATAYPTRYGNFAPRIGLAYQLSNSSRWQRVLRAGWGVFYDTGSDASATLQGPYSARCNNLSSCTLPPFTGSAIPFVPFPIATANARFVNPPVFPSSFTFPISQGTDVLIDPRFKQPYVYQMNATLEQQLGGPQTLTLSYVGALGHNLLAPIEYPPSLTNPDVLGNGTTGDTITVFGNYAYSDYQALQAKFERQFTAGLGTIVSYAWSHSIDDNSTGSLVNLGGASVLTLPSAAELASGLPTALVRASSDFDIRESLAFSVVYETPKLANRLANTAFSHWTLSPIYHYQTATPVDIFANVNGVLGATTGLVQRPNLIPGVPIYVTDAPGGRALNTAPVSAAAAASAGCIVPNATNAKGAFCTPAPIGGQSVTGNFGRNVIRGFPLQELDFSLQRDIPLRESVRLRFQADMFNVFNHPNFGPFGTNVSTSTFGRATAMANSFLGSGSGTGAGFNPLFNTGGPRNFQFALKLLF